MLDDVFADSELGSRTVRIMTVENPTRTTMTFSVCHGRECLDVDLGANERVHHRWSRWQRDLEIVYDADMTDRISEERLRITPAIATADRPMPVIPHYTFYETDGRLELLLRRIE